MCPVFVILSCIIGGKIVYCELETVLSAIRLNSALQNVTSFSCFPFVTRQFYELLRSDGHSLLSVARMCLVHKPNISKSLFDSPVDGRVDRSPSA